MKWCFEIAKCSGCGRYFDMGRAPNETYAHGIHCAYAGCQRVQANKGALAATRKTRFVLKAERLVLAAKAMRSWREPAVQPNSEAILRKANRVYPREVERLRLSAHWITRHREEIEQLARGEYQIEKADKEEDARGDSTSAVKPGGTSSSTKGLSFASPPRLAIRLLQQKVERKRHNELDEGAKVKRQPKARLQFAVAVKHWLALKRADWSDNNLRIETANFGHLQSHFGGMLLSDISAEDISRYKIERKKKDASPRTIAMEIGSLRALMRKHRLWADIQPDVKLPRGREDVGRALSADEEHRLLTACKKNRSRSLYPAVLLSLHTGLRNEELRLARWRQDRFAWRR